MAKRFIDTDIFDDDWFMDLSLEAKILWIYFITKCNHAGILKLNVKLCKVQTGIKSMDTVTQELGNRLVTVSEHLYFIPKFIEFQYPGFPNSNVRQQQSAIEILEKYGLFNNGMVTVTEVLGNTYDNDNGNDIGGVGEKNWKTDFEIYKEGLRESFKQIQKDEKFIKQQQMFYPKVDIIKSIYKSITNFWATEAGWKNKKSKRIKDIDWVSTFKNAIDKNKVYIND